MRRIGTLTDGSLAQTFCDYLLSRSIEAVATADGDGSAAAWQVWVRDESDVDAARQEFAAFTAAPQADRFQVTPPSDRDKKSSVKRRASDRHDQAGSGAATARSKPSKGASRWRPRQQRAPVMIAIIGVAVLLSLVTNFGDPPGEGNLSQSTLQERTYDSLTFVDPGVHRVDGDDWASLRQGQVWRLITPMFLHGDMFHLAFNMMWVFYFGTAIERLHGSWFFIAVTLITQLAAMLLQVSLPDADFIPEPLRGSPYAIGASGVVYGLFGYLWIRSQLSRHYPIVLDPMNVWLLLGWLVLCMTPAIEDVANGAHLGGLLGGMLIASATHLIRR